MQRAALSRYDQAIVRRLEKDLGRRLLEVGCGAGTMTRYLCDRQLLVAVDSSAEFVRLTRERLRAHPNVAVLQVDITAAGECLTPYGIDSVLCSNVLEHLADDELALREIARLLPGGGKLVVVVPAGRALYGSLDVSAGHYRRYTLEGLRSKLARAGFVERDIGWLNAIGVLGWFLVGRILRRVRIPDWQIRLFDVAARPIVWVESRLGLRFGLTLVVACEKRPTGR